MPFEWPSSFGAIIITALSNTIPDSTPVLLLRPTPNGPTLLQIFAERLRKQWGLRLVVIGLPETDRSHPEIQELMHRLEPGIELWFGESCDSVKRVSTIMRDYGLAVALKLRGKDFFAHPGTNHDLVRRHIATGADFTYAQGSGAGLAGVVLNRAVVHELSHGPHRRGSRPLFSDLWSNTALRPCVVESTICQGVDLQVADRSDLSFIRHCLPFVRTNHYDAIMRRAKAARLTSDRWEALRPQLMELMKNRLNVFLQQGTHRPVLFCLAAHRWDDIPQRNHHLLRRLAKKYRVVFFECEAPSIRTSLPAPSPAGLSDSAILDSAATATTRPVEDLMLLRCPSLSDFNIHMREEQLRAPVRSFIRDIIDHTQPDVVLVYFPEYYDMIEDVDLSCRLLVYDCCDEFSAFKGNWPDISSLERRLVKECDLVFASSRRLEKRLRKFCKQTHLLPNGVEYSRVNSRACPSPAMPVPMPVIGFIGGIAEWFDQDLVSRIATAHPAWQFVLFGPVIWTDVSLLRAIPNIHFMGPLHYTLIANTLRSFDVCIIPFKINRLTRSVDPVKLYEYLAAGKPVVSTPLPEVLNHSDVVAVAKTPREFAAAIRDATTLPHDVQRAKGFMIAKKRDWDRLAEEMHQDIEHSMKAQSGHI